MFLQVRHYEVVKYTLTSFAIPILEMRGKIFWHNLGMPSHQIKSPNSQFFE